MSMVLFDNVEARLPEYKEFLKEIVNINSYTPDKEDVDSVAAVIRNFALQHGFSVRTVPFEKAGDGLVISFNEDASMPAIAFTGHMDTVFPKGRFQSPMFREENGRFYGPGIADMKGGIAVGLLAMQAIKDSGYCKRPIKLILIGDEELSEGLSGEAGKDFIRKEAKGCAAAITLETARPGMITVGRKGSIRYRVKVTGRESHAGSNYKDGRSAIKEAAHKILDIEASSDQEQITYNCGMISGGTSPNTVPGSCEFTLYNRYWKFEQRQQIRDHVESILATAYIQDTVTSYEIIGERPPMEPTAQNAALCAYVDQISRRFGFGAWEPHLTSSGSDAAYTSMAGTPSICSMGLVGGRIHSTDEYAEADSLAAQAKLLAVVIENFPNELE